MYGYPERLQKYPRFALSAKVLIGTNHENKRKIQAKVIP
jgi:hypothetical protein